MIVGDSSDGFVALSVRIYTRSRVFLYPPSADTARLE
jgi:hypothetical protein